MMRRQLTACVLTILLAACGEPSSEVATEALEGNELRQALSLTPIPENGREIFADCAACHQSTGWGVADGSVPQIAGQHYEVLLKQLADMRNNERHNVRMATFVDSDDISGPQALADVSAYIAELQGNTEPGVGPGTDLARGEQLYTSICRHCHGADGYGDNELRIPRIQGQHYAYLVRQLGAFAGGERHNIDAATATLFADLSETEISAVADYISRISPSRLVPGGTPDTALVPD